MPSRVRALTVGEGFDTFILRPARPYPPSLQDQFLVDAGHPGLTRLCRPPAMVPGIRRVADGLVWELASEWSAALLRFSRERNHSHAHLRPALPRTESRPHD